MNALLLSPLVACFFLLGTAFAQDLTEETFLLDEETLLAAIDDACDCDLSSEEESEQEVSDESEELEEEQEAPGRCISQLSKLRRSLKNLAFFGLVDENFDLKVFVKEQKRDCREARKEDRREKRGKGKKNKGEEEEE